VRGVKITFKREALDKILNYLVEGYPFEAAGLMLSGQGARKVVDFIPVKNVHKGDIRVRYAVDPLEYYRAEKQAEEMGLEIIGVCHSHPDVAPRPSAYDLEYALPGWSYLIASVTKGRALGYACWRAVEKEGVKQFAEEEIDLE
jgi:proteasome lid subunit RPN8/RPN11